MPVLKTAINPATDEFKANAKAMQSLVADLEAKRAEFAIGGPEKLRERHVARGKLLPRDRIMGLIDPGTPFLELSQFAAFGQYSGDIHGRRRHNGRWPRVRPRSDDRLQRRHHQGRHLLSDDGEEARPCPGNRLGEPGCRASIW